MILDLPAKGIRTCYRNPTEMRPNGYGFVPSQLFFRVPPDDDFAPKNEPARAGRRA